MSNLIELEHSSCPKCASPMPDYTISAKVSKGVLCLFCMKCGEAVPLVVKGGSERTEEEKREALSTARAKAEAAEELGNPTTTKEE